MKLKLLGFILVTLFYSCQYESDKSRFIVNAVIETDTKGIVKYRLVSEDCTKPGKLLYNNYITILDSARKYNVGDTLSLIDSEKFTQH